jgi:hypothetical protein
LSGFFPSFARATRFAIGRQGVLSLGGWAPRIQTSFHVSGPTQVPDWCLRLTPTGLSPSAAPRSSGFGSASSPVSPVLQPHPDESRWFGLFRVRSPLLTESLLLSFPPGTEMFQFPGLAAYPYGFRVGLFGHPGLNARLTAPPGISQPSHALPRLLAPRHPPHALSSLAALIPPSLRPSTPGSRPQMSVARSSDQVWKLLQCPRPAKAGG